MLSVHLLFHCKKQHVTPSAHSEITATIDLIFGTSRIGSRPIQLWPEGNGELRRDYHEQQVRYLGILLNPMRQKIGGSPARLSVHAGKLATGPSIRRSAFVEGPGTYISGPCTCASGKMYITSPMYIINSSIILFPNNMLAVLLILRFSANAEERNVGKSPFHVSA